MHKHTCTPTNTLAHIHIQPITGYVFSFQSFCCHRTGAGRERATIQCREAPVGHPGCIKEGSEPAHLYPRPGTRLCGHPGANGHPNIRDSSDTCHCMSMAPLSPWDCMSPPPAADFVLALPQSFTFLFFVFLL